jgi:hypothetical protein
VDFVKFFFFGGGVGGWWFGLDLVDFPEYLSCHLLFIFIHRVSFIVNLNDGSSHPNVTYIRSQI